MPDARTVNRLLSYYKSSMFNDDFLRIVAAGGDTAEKHLEYMVSQMNEKLSVDGYLPTADDIALQSLFLCETLGILDLLEIGRSFEETTVTTLAPRIANTDQISPL